LNFLGYESPIYRVDKMDYIDDLELNQKNKENIEKLIKKSVNLISSETDMETFFDEKIGNLANSFGLKLEDIPIHLYEQIEEEIENQFLKKKIKRKPA